MKTRMMKRLSVILVAGLAAAALMRLVCVHLELKYAHEALAGAEKCEDNLLAMSRHQTRQQAEKIATLETKLAELTAEKTRLTEARTASARLF